MNEFVQKEKMEKNEKLIILLHFLLESNQSLLLNLGIFYTKKVKKQ